VCTYTHTVSAVSAHLLPKPFLKLGKGHSTLESKSRTAMAKAALNKNNTLFTSKLDLNLRKNLVECYIWNIHWYGAETWSLRKKDQNCLESLETWCRRRMEISWTDRVRNLKYLQSHGKEEYPINNKNNEG